jgi:hypothetical protein
MAFRYILILCNSIGTPIDSKYTEVKPDFLTMGKYHVVVASEDRVSSVQLLYCGILLTFLMYTCGSLGRQAAH